MRKISSFIEILTQLAIQIARRLQIVSERLFDNDARPAAIVISQLQTPDTVNDVRIQARQRRQIIQPIAVRPSRFLLPDLSQPGVKPIERRLFVRIALHIKNARCETVPHLVGEDVLMFALTYGGAQLVAKGVIVPRTTRLRRK